MNWILKNKNSASENLLSKIFTKSKTILRDKRTATLIVVLFWVLVFSFLLISDAHAASAESSKWSPTYWLNSVGSKIASVAGTVGQAAAKVILLPVSLVLWAVHGVTIMYLAIAGVLFGAMVNPDMMSGPTGIFNNEAVKNVWVMTRDVFNMFFILVLLFSAFCTIFQVEKWSIKKVWVNILIASLLVNFSYAIARFIIDISNVAMYYFLNHMFESASGSATTSGNTIFANFATVSRITQILSPGAGSFLLYPITYQIMMIVYTFILAQTLMTIAVFFVIRLAMLTMIIMFAPIGFVGYIFPGTHKYADGWWEKLFKYSFFGPVMIFMLAVSLHVAAAIGKVNGAQFTLAGLINGDAASGPFIANAALFAVPIILLWTSTGIAQSAGVVGASTVISGSRKAGMWFSGGAFARDTYRAYRARRDQAKGDNWSNRLGNTLGNKQDQLRGKFGGYAGRHAKQRYESADNQKAEEEKKLHNITEKTSLSEIKNLQQANRDANGKVKDRHVELMLNRELADRGESTAKELDYVKDTFGETSQAFKDMQNRVKKFDPVTAFTDKSGTDWTKVKEHVNSSQFKAENMGKNALEDDKLQEMLFDEKIVDAKSYEKIRTTKNAASIGIGLNKLAKRSNRAGNTTHQEIHLAHLAQTGEFADTGNGLANTLMAGKIAPKINAETGKRMKESAINAGNEQVLADYMKPGALKGLLVNMKDAPAAKKLQKTLANTSSTSENAKELKKIATAKRLFV